jgi:flagellar M-ring protein FliF
VNFDRLERTVEAVDPDRQALTSEQRSEIIPGAEGGAGSTNQSATYANSRSVEIYQEATGTVQRLSVAVVVNDREITDGETTRFEARSEAELARIESLVRSAIGIDDSRGDAISVASVVFGQIAPVEEPASGIQILGVVEQVQRPVVAIVGLLLAFVVALKLIGLIRATPVPPGLLAPGAVAGALATSSGSGGSATDPQTMESGHREPIGSGASTRDRVAAQLMDQPDVAARLVRGWLKEG